MKPLLVGQAPARSGDGTPFSGPSGRRLCMLLGATSLGALSESFELTNLISRKLPRASNGKGDIFLADEAERGARALLDLQYQKRHIIACGRQVWLAFGARPKAKWFEDQIFWPHGEVIHLWLFPHPSGISHFWNSPVDVLRAERFLKRMAITR